MRNRVAIDRIQMFSYFIFVCLTGSCALSLPFSYKSRIPVSYIDALFTSVSAVCVTGLSSVDMSVYSSAGFVVIMTLIELGGLGIISFVSIYFIVPKRRVSLVTRSMLRDFFLDDVETHPRRILRAILCFTLLIETAGALILFFSFRAGGSRRPFLDAVFHSVSAFCNAGFSTYSDSLAGFRSCPAILLTVMFLIVSGGIGFLVLTDLYDRVCFPKRKLSFHSCMVLISTAILIFGAASLFFVVEYNHAMSGFSFFDRVLASLFQAITPRTAGFEVISQKAYFPLTKLVTGLLMFIGGSPGSIAGGVKTTTFMVVVLYAIRGNTERTGLNIGNRNIGTAVIEKAFSIVSKSLMIVFLSLALLLCTERNTLMSNGCSIFDLLFEVLSAFGTVGLSLGVTAGLSVSGKAVVIATMFIGRTGIFAMALGFRRNQNERFYEYPSANIMVG